MYEGYFRGCQQQRAGKSGQVRGRYMKLCLPGDTKSDLGLTAKVNLNPVKYLAMKQQLLDCKA